MKVADNIAGEIHGIPVVAVDEDIVAEARGVIGCKRVVVGTDFNALTTAEQMAVLEHEAAHCLGYHLEVRIVLVAALLGILFALVNWVIIAAAAIGIGGMVALQMVSHAQEYEADAFTAKAGHDVGLKAFLRRCKNLPPSELHPSPRARLRALQKGLK